ncbi:DUF1190 domain-containing protein [Hahella ganghwensis]|uniref:DUF1190 domain-containing protein n=1 Tax=Hahella ganghwensis TaxID=286420 RepID=UPI0003688B64|nr:DUF1190 domain-containing protein [Hahella ganghwensis]
MKRSKNIDIDRLRKRPQSFAKAPLAIGVTLATVNLAGCGSEEQVKVVSGINDCSRDTPLSMSQCQAAYERALVEAERTAPKYRSEQECESEFDECYETYTGQYAPVMSGFVVSAEDDDELIDIDYHAPVYRYHRPFSPRDDWYYLGDGTAVGKAGKSTYKLPTKSVTTKLPTMTKTVQRGGFGSTASAKSSWGGGSRSGGWGG